MRVTNSMMISNMLNNLTKNVTRMDKYNQMMATGKKFLKPSDDPIGVSKSLRLNTDVNKLEQYKRNTEDALSWLQTTEQALSNMQEVIQRVRELTIQGATDTNQSSERNAIALEINQLKEQAIGTANTSFAGSYIFSGYKTDKPLLDGAGKYNIVQTNTETINYNVGISEQLSINILGKRLFGTTAGGASIDQPIDSVTDPAVGQDTQLIGVFDSLITDLQTGNTSGIRSAIKRIDINIDNINALRAEIGVKNNRLDLTGRRIDDDIINQKELLSTNEDADMAQVIMNMQNEENVYKASLSSGAKIIQPSLVDFLR